MYHLNDAGYHLSYSEPYVLLRLKSLRFFSFCLEHKIYSSESDVKIKNTYVDRSDNNKNKTFNPKDAFSWSFVFQESKTIIFTLIVLTCFNFRKLLNPFLCGIL